MRGDCRVLRLSEDLHVALILLVAFTQPACCSLPPPPPAQDLYGGFLDFQLAEDFANYADIVFQHLGPYVKHWLTFNEPMSICQLGYGVGVHAPGVRGASKAQYR